MEQFKTWKSMLEGQVEDANEAYWNSYFEKERNVYSQILADKSQKISGTISELAEKYNMELVEFVGFIDGINGSLEESIDLDEVQEDTIVTLNIMWDKLYWNMMEAKADWLYQLEEWNDILDEGTRQELSKAFKQSKQLVRDKVGRNEPCPCGSGKKYKKCCGAAK